MDRRGLSFIPSCGAGGGQFVRAAAAALSLLDAAPVLAQEVGSVGAVNPRSIGTPSGGATRNLVLGARVISNEHIQTSGDGTANITFLDRTTLAIGRNSSVTIDKYVYDPQAETGVLNASMAKGVMRFIGGQISHTSGVEITTPVATIGVRGGMATIRIQGDGSLMVFDHFGHIDVANHAGHQLLLRSGFALHVTGPNDPIADPIRAPLDLLNEDFALLASHAGQHGGAHDLPRDYLASRFGIGDDPLPNDPDTMPGLDTVGLVNTAQSFAGNRGQQVQWNGSKLPPRCPPRDR